MHKKLFYLFSIYYLSFSISSCSEFVEVEPIGPVGDNYFTEPEHYDSALIGAYDMLQTSFWNVQTATIASPDFIAGGDSNNYDQPTLQDVDKMIHDQTTYEQIRAIWENMYAGMNRTNFILENKDKIIDFENKSNILGQTYFLRAYYAFELAKFFGDIPLIVDESSDTHRIMEKQITFGDQFNVNRVGSTSKVLNLIEEDLKDAISLLPSSQTDIWRASKYSAKSLLGRVLLYNKKYTEAADQLQDVIDSNKYELLQHGEEFNNIWESSSENSIESIFEVQYTSVEGASWSCFNCSEGNYYPKFNNPRSPFNGEKYIAGWGFNLPTQILYDAYKPGDSRRDLTIWDLRTDTTRSVGREDLGFFSKKYLATKENDLDRKGSDPLNYTNNYRAIRYADVLLMAAEAYAMSGNSNKAIEYLNLVRARAFGNNNHDYKSTDGDLMENIILERRLELAGEGHYFFDLIRTENALDAFEEYNSWIESDKPTWGDEDTPFLKIDFKLNKNEVFPIPLVELELANAKERWGQNKGYN